MVWIFLLDLCRITPADVAGDADEASLMANIDVACLKLTLPGPEMELKMASLHLLIQHVGMHLMILNVNFLTWICRWVHG